MHGPGKEDGQAAKDLIGKARRRVGRIAIPASTDPGGLTVNPALELVQTGEGLTLIWRHPGDGGVHAESAESADILALKIVIENLDLGEVSRETELSEGRIYAILERGVERGLLLSPPSLIRRTDDFTRFPSWDDHLLVADVFTLQWHITQQCELSCRHCYDRSSRRATGWEESCRILEDFRSFCSSRFVRGQVSFSGGNPFLHPQFAEIYRKAAELGFAAAILCNPVSRSELEKILAIRMPVYVQVSLEGLEEHNDHIRGNGHFRRTIEFLDLMREMKIPSEVMLTLTGENIAQVLELGELLRDRTDAFSCNRLASFGAGAELSLPAAGQYRAFIDEYLKAMENNPVLALKDNLFNIALERRGGGLFGGCAGYGCGAAFNFVALLPDGEVHACRKFPSYLGNMNESPLAEIYDSQAAARYRSGSAGCAECRLRAVCRGCPAVTAGLGQDPALVRDPFCFREG